MRKEDILSKGLYVHSQVADLVSVKQYIIAKFKNKKALFLRFLNEREENATAMTLRIRQYDVRGEFICAETIEVKHLNVTPGTEFTVKNPMIIKDSCVDFRVDIINVAYGDYTYDVIDGEAHIRFAKADAEVKKSINTNQLRLELDGKSQKVSVRSLKAPTMLVLVCCVILLSLLTFSIGQLAYYMYTETCFTLDNFEYEFLTDNKDDGPIRLTKYKGFALNLVIPAEIEGYEIGAVADTAFAGTDLRSITFEGNTEIEYGAFMGCKKLHTVKIENVETIGDEAFSGCVALKNLTLGDSLKKIGNYAFSGCAELESVELCEGIESVGKYAFEDCLKIEKLNIPSTVEEIGYGVVSGCNMSTLSVPFIGSAADDLSTLSHFYGVSDNSKVRNALVNLTVTNQIEIPDGTFENCVTLRNVDFTLPVTRIGNNAFKGCKRIDTFEIDETVKFIGENAFYDCLLIDGIVIPKGIERIEAGTFYNCRSLSVIDIPESVRTVGRDAFKLCTSLKTLNVPKTVIRLEEGAFADCTSLIEITIPFIGYSSREPASMRAVFGDAGAESIKSVNLTGSGSICDGAFADMISLERVYLNAKITSIGQDAFSGCKSLARITMSDNVSYIGDRAFLNCESLDNLSLPEKLGYIGESVFEGCASLSEVSIPEKVTEIGAYAFAGCESLSEVIWPDTIEDIGEGAFKGCSTLMSVSVPTGVTSIKKSTFENCEMLSSVVIAAEVTSIGERAFAGCSSLQGVALPNALERIEKEAFADCEMLGMFTLPMSVTELGSGILSGCTSLETLTVHFMSESFSEERLSGNIGYLFDSDNADNALTPDSLNTVNLVDIAVITEGAFTGCAGLYTVNLPQSLTCIEGGSFEGSGIVRIIVPEGVTVIEESTFKNCERLNTVTLPKHLVTIESNAFSGCDALETVKLYNALESIGDNAFYGCASIKNLEIPKSVKIVGESVLEGCVSLETLVIPFIGSARDSNENMSYLLGQGDVETLKKITVTDSQQLPERAFAGLASVEEIVLPKEMYTVGDYAFSGCSSLKSLEIPGTVTYLGVYSLEGCDSLESLTIPFVGVRRDEAVGITNLFNGTPSETLKMVTVTQSDIIPDSCFENCEFIEKIIIDAYVESIGQSAFKGCSSLVEITLPETVKSIDDYAFSGCSQLRSITLPKKLTNLSSVGVFTDCYKLFEIYNHSEYISIQPGNGINGQPGHFAINVYVGDEQPVKVSVGGFDFLRQNGGVAWYLINYDADENGICSVPAEFTYDGATISAYHIPKYLFYMEESVVELTLPSSVVSIGEHAFYGCSNLTKADIASAQISEIPVNLFAECASLVEVTFPENIVNICDGAFRNCVSLESVKVPGFFKDDIEVQLPESLIYIGREAFYNCANIKSVNVPELVTKIDEDAFYGCDVLEHVYNLSILEIIEREPDHGFVAFNALIVDNTLAPETLHTVEIGELVFKKSDDRWILIGHTSTDGTIELMPFTYQNKAVDSYIINYEAFKGDESLTKVVFSNAVSKIGMNAFAGCSNLAEVDFSGNNILHLNNISWITELPSIRTIAFPRTLTTFPSEVLNCFDSLETVSFAGNVHITSIPSDAFGNFKSTLKTVVLPDCLEIIESDAFYDCARLENITMSNSITTIGDRAFQYCYSLKAVEMPDALVTIGAGAFLNSGIESLTFKGNVSSIGDRAFAECYSLKTVDLSAATALNVINYGTFSGCSSLETVALPSRLEEIGSSAFNSCSTLKQLVTTSSLNSIGEYAFAGCNSLQRVVLERGLESIGAGAFSGCSALENVSVPSTVATISEYAFSNSGLKSVTLGGCETIGYEAFAGCEQLVTVNFPTNIKYIGESAFIDCTELMNVNLSRYTYLVSIGMNAFMNCDSLKTVNLSNCTRLTTIDYSAFSGCTELETLNLSGCTKLTEIGDSAFMNCSSLKSADMSGCQALQLIGDSAFNQCDALESLTLTGCTALRRIGPSAFYGCESLKNVDLSGLTSLTSIDSYCFKECSALESVRFPSSLASMGVYAFEKCEALKSVDLSVCTNMTDIPSNAFRSCTSLETAVFPTRLARIGSYAFYNCSSLKPIKIPKTLTGTNCIGSNAFYGCEGLYEIWCEGSRSDLVPGSTDKGYIAYYAIAIHYSYSEAPITFYTLEQNGVTYEFAYDSGVNGGADQRYLIGATGYTSGDVFQFPTTTGYKYTVSRFLADDVTFGKAYVPTCIQGFEQKYLSNWTYPYPYIYYAGSSDNLGIQSRCYFYTYVSCKHESGNTWYGASTDPQTSICGTEERVAVDSTCTETGVMNVFCERCGNLLYTYAISLKPHTTAERVTDPTCSAYGKKETYCTVCGTVTETEQIDKLPHTYGEDEKCTVCGAEYFDVQAELEKGLSFDTTSTGYTFATNGAGEYVSSNAGYSNTKSVMTYTASEDMTVTVIYSVSSESTYDIFKIYHGNTLVVSKSGTVNQKQIIIDMKAGEIISFEYSKDVSADAGMDCATIHSINLEPVN